jgi:hypothetical protein
MNVVDGHDQPILVAVQAIQAAVLALEMITLENLHGFLAREARGGPKQESRDVFEGHGTSFRSLCSTWREHLGPDDFRGHAGTSQRALCAGVS